mgnify:CR=1 FL=1
MHSFCFCQIDPDAPLKRYSFTLHADNDTDAYAIEDCEPPIDDDLLMQYVDDLNAHDDLGLFIKNMRAAFQELLKEQNS